MYRALITVHDPATGKRLGKFGLAEHTAGLRKAMGRGWIGTRRGVPGIWITEHTKDSFRYDINRAVIWAENTGFAIEAITTNQPSQDALRTMPIKGYRA